MTPRRKVTVVCAFAVIATLLATSTGCGGRGNRPAAASTWRGPKAASSPSVTPSAPTTPSIDGAAGEITVAFAGDVHFTGRTAGLLARPETAFGPIAPVLRAADLAMVNLETAVTERGTAEPKTFHFRAPITALDAVRAAGVDVVTLANNHVLDYGQVGLADTLDNARKADFPYVGIGRNAAEAYAPWITTVKGVKIAVLGFSQIHELAYTWAAKDNRPGVAMAMDLARATAAVAAARGQADVVIVFNHWGREGNSCATGEQKTFATRLADAGADLVVGAHAHTLQGDGWIKDTYVAYGLGNFVWWGDSHSTETGVLKVTLLGRKVVKNELVPAVVSRTGQPVPLAGAAATRVSSRFAGLRQCAGLAARRS